MPETLIESGFTPSQAALYKSLLEAGNATTPTANYGGVNATAGTFSGQTFSAPIPVASPGIIPFHLYQAASAAKQAKQMASQEQVYPNINAPVFDLEKAKGLAPKLNAILKDKYNARILQLKELSGNDPAGFVARVKADTELANIASEGKAISNRIGEVIDIVNAPNTSKDPYKKKVLDSVQNGLSAYLNVYADPTQTTENVTNVGMALERNISLAKGKSAYDLVTETLGDQFINPAINQIGKLPITDPNFESLVSGIEKSGVIDEVALDTYLDSNMDVIMGAEGTEPYKRVVDLYGDGDRTKAWDNLTSAIKDEYRSRVKNEVQLINNWKQRGGSVRVSGGGQKGPSYLEQNVGVAKVILDKLPETQRTATDFIRAIIKHNWQVSYPALKIGAYVYEKRLDPLGKDVEIQNPSSIQLLAPGKNDRKMRLWDYPITPENLDILVNTGILEKVDNSNTSTSILSGALPATTNKIVMKQNTSPVAKIFYVDDTSESVAGADTKDVVGDVGNLDDYTQYVAFSSPKEFNLFYNGALYRAKSGEVVISAPNTPNFLNNFSGYPNIGSQEDKSNFNLDIELPSSTGGQ